jgi:hypothetical protein
VRRERNSGCLVLLLCFKLGLSREVFVASESLVEFSEEEEEDKEKPVTKDIEKNSICARLRRQQRGPLGDLGTWLLP